MNEGDGLIQLRNDILYKSNQFTSDNLHIILAKVSSLSRSQPTFRTYTEPTCVSNDSAVRTYLVGISSTLRIIRSYFSSPASSMRSQPVINPIRFAQKFQGFSNFMPDNIDKFLLTRRHLHPDFERSS